jgi:hypothetical protein
MVENTNAFNQTDHAKSVALPMNVAGRLQNSISTFRKAWLEEDYLSCQQFS